VHGMPTHRDTHRVCITLEDIETCIMVMVQLKEQLHFTPLTGCEGI